MFRRSFFGRFYVQKMKWNESGFRPPLCTYRLNWARRTSWGWWDDRDDTVLQTQDSKFEPWRSEAEHATSRSRRLPTILTFTRGWGRNIFVSFKPPRPGTEPRTLAWKAAVLTTTLGSYVQKVLYSVAPIFRRSYVKMLLFLRAPMFGMSFINKRPEVLYHPPPLIRLEFFAVTNFSVFAPTKNYEVIHGSHFEFQ